MATIAELKKLATELALTFKSKITKPELETMIDAERQRRTDEANKAFVDANSTRIPPRLLPASPPRNVPMTAEVRESHYRSAANGGNKLTGKQVKRLRQKLNKNG